MTGRMQQRHPARQAIDHDIQEAADKRADDEAHLQITEAFIQDDNVDAVVVGLDPTAPSVRALAESKKRSCSKNAKPVTF